MKRIFYIDIENVGMKEISRIRELKETDKVILFINKNEKELYKKVCFELSGSKAAVEIQTFNSRVKNALDFQICLSIGMFTEQISGEIYIVSKDKGYESAIEFFKNQGKTIKGMKDFKENYKGKPEEMETAAAMYISKKLGCHWNVHRECTLELAEDNAIKVSLDYNPTSKHPQGYEQTVWVKDNNSNNQYVPVFSTYNIYEIAKEVLKRAAMVTK